MKQNYIQAPQISQAITTHKGKAPKVKHVKREEVPEFYRKKRPEKLIALASEILLYLIGLVEFIRKEMKYGRN